MTTEIDEKFSKALKYLLDNAQRGTQANLARETKIHQQTISAVYNGLRSMPEAGKHKVADFFGYTYDDFLLFGDRLLKGIENKNLVNFETYTNSEKKFTFSPTDVPAIPLKALASCSTKGIGKTIPIPISVSPPVWSQESFAVMATGDSMEPAGISEGMLCYCDPAQEPIQGDAVYVEQNDGHATIKIFVGWGKKHGVNDGWLRLQGWLPKQENQKVQEGFFLDLLGSTVVKISTIIFIRRRM